MNLETHQGRAAPAWRGTDAAQGGEGPGLLF